MADSRGPRLFTDLNNVFKRDPKIDEYDILPVLEPTHNRSPFILQEHKLGVEAWAVKVLLKYVASKLFGWRHQDPSVKFIDPAEILNLTRAMLLFTPDNYTAWNIRKELIESNYLNLSDDLSFGALVLTKHPKSAETFIHRRWLFQQLLDNCLSSSLDSNGPSAVSATPVNNADCFVNMELIDIDIIAGADTEGPVNINYSLECNRLFKLHTQLEVRVCVRAAEHYPCNYHAWSHRIWIVQQCLNCSLQVLLKELKETELWCSTHISDHSGFHYRQFLLSELLQRQEKLSQFSINPVEIFLREMAFVCDLIHSYPGHEALWYHRRFLLHTMLNSHILNQCSKVTNKTTNGFLLSSDQGDQNHVNRERSLFIGQEIDLVNCQMRTESSKYNQSLANKYVQWLQALNTTV